jgi:RecB family exonuclease
MASQPRLYPSVYVTSVAKHLAGDTQCLYPAYLKAHYWRYDKLPSTFDSTTWQAEHTALLAARVAELREAGDLVAVYVEDQNRFEVPVRGGIRLVGKPDLVAVYPDRIVVEDAKTGMPRAADTLQVMLYMVVAAHLPDIKHRLDTPRPVMGQVVYRGQVVEIPPTGLDPVS